jgi:hypothetical protein
MSEKVINEALNGFEIKTALTKYIMDALRKECHLRDDWSYMKFDAKISISVRLHDVGGVNAIHREVTVGMGAVPEGENPDEYLEQFDAEIEIGEQDPNTVRQETEQPIPVLTTKNGKPSVERIKYAPKGKK